MIDHAVNCTNTGFCPFPKMATTHQTRSPKHTQTSSQEGHVPYLLQGLEVAFALAHFFTVQHEVTIAAHCLWPLVWLIRPDGGVVVQGHGQMVANQVLQARIINCKAMHLSLCV